jgi:uncharacterized membrane protein
LFYTDSHTKMTKWFKYFQENKELTLILFFAVVIRLFLLDLHSYWFDELISVVSRGIRFDSSWDVINHHRTGRLPYPMYEFMLFNWMKVFGHSEISTRFLSSILVLFSILVLYLFAKRILGKRLAIAAILFYSLSFSAVHYSLEARYYALVLFLTILSSYTLVLFLESIKSKFGWRQLFANRFFALLVITNFLALHSHPFVLLFLGAQGLFMMVYFTTIKNTESFLFKLVKALTVAMLPILLYAFIWGSHSIVTIANDLTGTSEVTVVEEASKATGFTAHSVDSLNPFLIFWEYVAKRNFFKTPHLILFVFFALALVFFIKRLRFLLQNKASARILYWLYPYFWLFIPCILVSVVFALGGYDKLHHRYLVYCVPPLMIILILSLEQGIKLLHLLTRKVFKTNINRMYIQFSLLFTLMAAALLVAPGGISVAYRSKHDWRGITRQVVNMIEQDQKHKYTIYETLPSSRKLSDYYFKRHSDEIRLSGVIKRSEEDALSADINQLPRIFQHTKERELAQHDYLVVLFIHNGADQYVHTLNMLSERYTLVFKQLDEHNNKGYVVFQTDTL